MRSILSLADVTDSHRVTMDTSVDDAFCVHTTTGITRYGQTKDRMRAVNGCDSNIVSRSELKCMFKKKEIAKKKEPGPANLVAADFVSLKKNKLCLTNLVVENPSCLSPY